MNGPVVVGAGRFAVESGGRGGRGVRGRAARGGPPARARIRPAGRVCAARWRRKARTGRRHAADGRTARPQNRPGIQITREVVVGEPVTVLEIESRPASLAAVGSRGHTRFGRLLLGRAEALGGPGERYPDVVVHRRPVRGRIRSMLVEASADAGLAVVGARGHGGFTELLLGSVSQADPHQPFPRMLPVPRKRGP